jgi:ribosome-associated translation inhibitor RaiA
MKKQFEILSTTRNNILKAIENLSEEQLNKISEGFKNSIIWNVAHVVVTQQLLCYKVSGLQMALNDEFIDKYKKGSEVNFEVKEDEVEYIKTKLQELPNKLQSDYNNAVFKSYTEYPTSYNVTLNNIEEAIQFNNVHEGLHLGYIMAMKKTL